MSNPWRGEVGLRLDGEDHVMRLTLGALAELEARLGAESLMALVARFDQGAFRASDLIALLAAGLRGGGWAGDEARLAAMPIEGGPVAAAKAAGELLRVTFAAEAP